MKKTNQIKADMKEWLDNDKYKGSSVYEQPPADASLTNSKPEAEYEFIPERKRCLRVFAEMEDDLQLATAAEIVSASPAAQKLVFYEDLSAYRSVSPFTLRGKHTLRSLSSEAIRNIEDPRYNNYDIAVIYATFRKKDSCFFMESSYNTEFRGNNGSIC
jgi:hypothetical protein